MHDFQPQQIWYCKLIVMLLFCTAALPKSYQQHSRKRPRIEISSNTLARQSLRNHKAPWEGSHTPTSSALFKILTNFLHMYVPRCDPLNRYSSWPIHSVLCYSATQVLFDHFDLEKDRFVVVTGVNFPSFRLLPALPGEILPDSKFTLYTELSSNFVRLNDVSFI